MIACESFHEKKKDYELKSIRKYIDTQYQLSSTEGEVIEEIDLLSCRECDGEMRYSPTARTLKCPKCHSKYTHVTKPDGTTVLKVNVDVRKAKKEELRRICGIMEEDESLKKKKAITKRYRATINKRKRSSEKVLKKKNEIDYDPKLRENLQHKYGKVEFYRPRILAILLSCILATLELKAFGMVEDWVIDRHVFGQLEQFQKCSKSSTIKQLRTAERVIAKHYWQVCKKIFKQLGFKLSNRKLMRYVREFLEQPFRGSKGYTPGNCLINNIHKICYERLRILLTKYGYGYECPGVAEHTNTKFGIVLDLSDFVKVAYRFELIYAICEGRITENNLHSILGRHDQEIHLTKRPTFTELERIVRITDHKVIYTTQGASNRKFRGVRLGNAFEEFVGQLAQDLIYKEELTSVFLYTPNVDDYGLVKDILQDYHITIPCLSSA